MLVIFQNICLSLKLKIPIMKIIFKHPIDVSILKIALGFVYKLLNKKT